MPARVRPTTGARTPNASQLQIGTKTLGDGGGGGGGGTHLGHDLANLLLTPVEPPLGALKLTLASLLRLDAAVPVCILVVLEALSDDDGGGGGGGAGAAAGAAEVRHGRLGESDALHGEVQTGDVGLQRADAREVDPELLGGLFRGCGRGGACGGREDTGRDAREGVVEQLRRWRRGRRD